jgi:hypothetical protein
MMMMMIIIIIIIPGNYSEILGGRSEAAPALLSNQITREYE